MRGPKEGDEEPKKEEMRKEKGEKPDSRGVRKMEM